MEELVANVLLGAAVGDAFGVPFEFMAREDIARCTLGPMVGKGDEGVPDSRWGSRIPAGAWSDDTSMAVAAMEAIADSGGEVAYDAVMCAFLRWWDEGRYCSIEYPFGLGGTISDALHRFRQGKEPLKCGGRGLHDNGNGSLMRIFPFSLICIARGYGADRTAQFIGEASAITHGHEISKMGCLIYTEFLRACVSGSRPAEALELVQAIDYGRWFGRRAVKAYARVMWPDFGALPLSQIGSSGYVVDTLEGALHSVLRGFELAEQGENGFEETVVQAVRIGYDTDTTACAAGSIAGALYGAQAIPAQWVETLKRKDYLQDVAKRFANSITAVTMGA